MALLTVQNVSESGLNPSFTAAAAGGDTFKNDDSERTFLVVKNGGVGGIVATISALVTSKSFAGYGTMTKTGPAVSVPAAGERWIGPFAGTVFNNSTGLVSVTYDDVTSVTVAVVKVPKQ